VWFGPKAGRIYAANRSIYQHKSLPRREDPLLNQELHLRAAIDQDVIRTCRQEGVESFQNPPVYTGMSGPYLTGESVNSYRNSREFGGQHGEQPRLWRDGVDDVEFAAPQQAEDYQEARQVSYRRDIPHKRRVQNIYFQTVPPKVVSVATVGNDTHVIGTAQCHQMFQEERFYSADA
jgi:hypothetical protein